MKHVGILLSMMFMCLIANAQMVGDFKQGIDGHLYFVASDQTWVTFNIRIVAVSTDRYNSEVITMIPNGGFCWGPTTPCRWYWKKGDTISVVYPNGQSQTWVCPQSDNAYNSSNVSFRGNDDGHCIHCGSNKCPYFRAKSGAYPTTCKCGHPKRSHIDSY